MMVFPCSAAKYSQWLLNQLGSRHVSKPLWNRLFVAQNTQLSKEQQSLQQRKDQAVCGLASPWHSYASLAAWDTKAPEHLKQSLHADMQHTDLSQYSSQHGLNIDHCCSYKDRRFQPDSFSIRILNAIHNFWRDLLPPLQCYLESLAIQVAFCNQYKDVATFLESHRYGRALEGR